ncbi:hypothetical protein SDC9_80660 [bioreactor metagenome]|uniref:DUF1292 domain-containing protein n=1 Tax=bioreactor metagenome TaxID=1076179 RepID=A0A644Z0K6_9ZZZZ
MSEDFGADYVTITDEDGHEIDLEHVNTIEYNGQIYMAFFPADQEKKDAEESSEEDELSLIILKVIEENGEELLSTLESEEEMEAVYEQFMDALFEDEEE